MFTLHNVEYCFTEGGTYGPPWRSIILYANLKIICHKWPYAFSCCIMLHEVKGL